MLNVVQEENRFIVDIREIVRQGMHPKKEVMEFIQQTPVGSVIEIHLPHPGQPLVAAIEGLGLSCILNELGPGHYRIMTLKM